MTTPADELQKIFRTLSDPTRLRILRLVEREPLVVQELVDVLGMTQSRISRHLGILREVDLVEDRREGTYVSYRYKAPSDDAWKEAWDLVGRQLDNDPTAQRDSASLSRVLEARGSRSHSFFDAVGAEWDALRTVFADDELRARALSRLVEPRLRVVDIGTGTGILALELARLGADVIGVDDSTAMLEAARSKWESEDHSRGSLTLRKGDAGRLPLEDGEADAAVAHMVLHSVASPGEVIAEMGRTVRPSGSVVAVDFLAHSFEWMRNELGALWLGFETDDIRSWFSAAGLDDPDIEIREPSSGGRELPATFIASARKRPT